MIVYLTRNIKNGKIYIGKQKNPEKTAYLGSGSILKKALKKHGKENFSKEVLCISDYENIIDVVEKFNIKWFKSQNRAVGYNLADGGSGGDLAKFKKLRQIHQYTIEGEYVASYLNGKDAERATGITNSKILVCCKNVYGRITTGGFRWSFDKLDNLKKLDRKPYQKIENYQKGDYLKLR